MQDNPNLPVFEIDLGNESDASAPRAKLLNWNTVNYADIYADQSGERSKITKIVLRYNNTETTEITGHTACQNFLQQFQQKMGYTFQSFLSSAVPASSSATGSGGGMKSRT